MFEKDRDYWTLVGLSLAVSIATAIYTVLKFNSVFEQENNESATKHF